MPPTKLLIPIILLSCTPRPSAQDATPLDLSPLSADQISIYKSFLASYTVGGKHRLNLINQTYPLRPKDLSADCLKGTGIALGPVDSAAHHLDSRALAEATAFTGPMWMRISAPEGLLRGAPAPRAHAPTK